MKKNLLKLTGISLIAGALMFTGCKKDDTTAPDVTLVGASSMTISLNSSFTDPGATATDDEDGDLTSQITVSGSVNKDLAGTYTLTYSVSDAAGNEGSATRTVIVKNDSENLAGAYNGVDTAPYPGTAGASYPLTVSVSSTKNNRLIISKFAYYVNAGVSVDVSGSSISIAPSPQTMTCGNPAYSHTFANSTINTSSTVSGAVLTIYYNDKYTDPINGAQNFEGRTVYTKQ